MKCLVAFLVLFVPAIIAAQSMGPQDVLTSVEDSRYRRALAVAGEATGPWAIDSTRRAFGLRAARIAVGGNSGLPNVREEGVAWSGRGMNVSGSVLAAGSFRALTVQLEPMIWWAQNTSFPLVSTAVTTPPYPFSDPARPRLVDLPQRFGDSQLARLDAGESNAVFAWRGGRVALTSAGRTLGSGSYHNIVMQQDAGGFPRLEIGTDRGIKTPLGSFSGTLASGRIAQSPWAPAERAGARHGSFFEGRWQPFGDERLALGGVRFYHRDWQGIRAKDLLVPFGSFFFDEQNFGGGDDDNQLAAVFMSARVADAGLELFAEFGKQDRSLNLRDLAVELEHNSAWLVGGQKAWLDSRGQIWSVTATGVSGRVPRINVFRPQQTFYEHFFLSQGHTSRGQLLGTQLLERTGGAEVRVDRYQAGGRTAAIISSRSLPNRKGVGLAEDFLRQEWSAWLEQLRFTSHGSYFARLGAIADIGRDPARGDSYSLSVSVGYTHRR